MKLLRFRPRSLEGSGESSGHQMGCLLLEHLDSLYSAAYRLTRRADIAEELVQETASKALKAKPDLSNDHTVRAWLFAVLFNAARDYLRRSKLREGEELSSKNPDLLNAFNLEALSWATVQDVRQALAALSPAWKEVVILIDLEQFTIAETAQILKLPPGTIASRLSRAHQALRDSLKAYASRASIKGGGP